MDRVYRPLEAWRGGEEVVMARGAAPDALAHACALLALQQMVSRSSFLLKSGLVSRPVSSVLCSSLYPSSVGLLPHSVNTPSLEQRLFTLFSE